ncbi:MAG: hypothetical protein M1816_007996 [Peltula sp. TS41687]|nr:MAG: hypothetical protein M1816_007996 [Peltula sp. TS41687]
MADENNIENEVYEEWARSRMDTLKHFATKGNVVSANVLVRKYGLSNRPEAGVDTGSWQTRTEIPTAREIMDETDGAEADEDANAVEIPVNRIDAPWGNKQDYLRTHYELLREDAIAPLRDAVAAVQAFPHMKDNKGACVYEKVYIIGYTFSQKGPAARVVFSTARAGKRIIWEQSKRLITGTLVALSPVQDKFRRDCKIAIVAARPLSGVQANPPEVDLFFSNPEESEIDPMQEWLMVEARTGYFEAYRHTMVGLQRMAGERFPMSEHLVDLKTTVDKPGYTHRLPLSTIDVETPKAAPIENGDLLDLLPASSTKHLDESQRSALERILTKKLAIIQGPPGTGKTHVSVTALRFLLDRATAHDPPIVIASQTNHALDQMLRHISGFEQNFVRLGGRSLDQDVIKRRTLYQLRKSGQTPTILHGLRGAAQSTLRRQERKMLGLLDPIHDQKEPISADLLRNLGLLTKAQYQSLQGRATGWVHASKDRPSSSMAAWLGGEFVTIGGHGKQVNLDLEYEEMDPEFEQIKEIEAEAIANDDEYSDSLNGTWRSISERFHGRPRPGANLQTVQQALQVDNLWEIPTLMRGAVYTHFQQLVKQWIRDTFREEAKTYMKAARELQIGMWEADTEILRGAKLIGMTTTGLSKYRPLVASVQPRIMLVEEAAETLEGLVTAGCVESLKHLILVGDHKQLRGHCTVTELEGEPFNLGVSMFERMIMNGVEYSTLTYQRNDELHDHESVMSREAVPGMGSTISYLFSHTWPESKDAHFSRCNGNEADMIIGFFNYLMYNGLKSEQITVLTFYNGQRKLILRKLRSHPNLQGKIFNVKTIDSYQGEENAVIILSLVRSNRNNEIGFLEIENRVCVALSRAQRGLYMFGNAKCLSKASSLWWKVVKTMANNPRRVGYKFPVTCDHRSGTGAMAVVKRRVEMRYHVDICALCNAIRKFQALALKEGFRLHTDSFSHDSVTCQSVCEKLLPCGHQCKRLCGRRCGCDCRRREYRPEELVAAEKRDRGILAWQNSVKNASKKPEKEIKSPEPLLIDFGGSELPETPTEGNGLANTTERLLLLNLVESESLKSSKEGLDLNDSESPKSSHDGERRANPSGPQMLLELGEPESPENSKKRVKLPEAQLPLHSDESESIGAEEEETASVDGVPDYRERATRAWQEFAKNPPMRSRAAPANVPETESRARIPEPLLLLDFGGPESPSSNEEMLTPADVGAETPPRPAITSVVKKMKGKDSNRTRWVNKIDWSAWLAEPSVAPLTEMEPSLLD